MQHREIVCVCVCACKHPECVCVCVCGVFQVGKGAECLLEVELMAVDLISYSDCLTDFCI